MARRFLGLGALMLLSAQVAAAPVYWNTWTSTSAGTIAAPTGTVGVSFSGAAVGVASSYPSWTPSATFADGALVDNGPVASNGIMQLTGGGTALNTIAFSTPVVNPVMSIWSLGQGGLTASFVFGNATPVFVSGGPNAEYGGSTIVVNGNTVSGNEGNGTVQFVGTFTSLSWTNPQYENWYGFNVGAASAVPLPAAIFPMAGGLAFLGTALRRRKRA